jgi:hypothetical protein
MYAARLDAVLGREHSRTIAAKPGDFAEISRSRNATSDGEFTLVGTLGVENVGGPLVRFTSESAGKTRYTSTTTFFISLVDAPNGIRPVKAAPVINVCWVSTKSSPASISSPFSWLPSLRRPFSPDLFDTRRKSWKPIRTKGDSRDPRLARAGCSDSLGSEEQTTVNVVKQGA